MRYQAHTFLRKTNDHGVNKACALLIYHYPHLDYRDERSTSFVCRHDLTLLRNLSDIWHLSIMYCAHWLCLRKTTKRHFILLPCYCGIACLEILPHVMKYEHMYYFIKYVSMPVELVDWFDWLYPINYLLFKQYSICLYIQVKVFIFWIVIGSNIWKFHCITLKLFINVLFWVWWKCENNWI